MGLLLEHVSRVVLLCVVLLRGNYVADAEQTSRPFVNMKKFFWMCSMNFSPGYETAWGVRPSQQCLHSAPIRFKENATGPVFSFSTKFIASIKLGRHSRSQLGYELSRNVLEGFTFALLPHRNASLGGDGGYLGLLNATSNGDPKSHTFAVEFDFVKSPQFSDPDEGFHIGIDINSMNTTSWAPFHAPSDRSRVWQMQVWIDYDASSQILNVSTADISLRDCPFLDEERTGPTVEWYNETTRIRPSNFLSVQVDLSKVLNENMYVGFTSSVAVPHNPDGAFVYLKRWSLRTSTGPAAPSASLPCYRYYSWNPTFFQSHPFETRLSAILVSLTAMAAIYALLYKCYSRWVERRGWRFKIDPEDLGEADPHKFTYKELAMATKNFDPKQVLGRGGFGSVYKGFLPGNKEYVAVKRVAPESSQGEREFLAEVMIIGKIRHRNLVRLQGWCHERGELLLVYDYMPQGSLDKHLFGSPISAMENLPNVRDQQGVDNLVTVDEEVVIGFPWERRNDHICDLSTQKCVLN